jgi:gamma-D-glutamyl-L-lysine dipeptidyl-peptidase
LITGENIVDSPSELVENLRREYFSDKRLAYANVHVAQHHEHVDIRGTVLDRPAAELLIGALAQRDPSVNWRDEMTPLVAGPDYSWALMSRSVADVREEPSHTTQRTTQILFGEPVEILRRSGNWAHIRIQDGYLGWTPAEPLRTCSAEAARDWSAAVNHIVRQPLLTCYADASGEPHQQVTLLPFGAGVHVEGADGPYRAIRCPDGVRRWVPATGLLATREIWGTGLEGLRTAVNWAQAVIGVPYLWGGKTPFGYDCSGLVQMLHSMVGIALRRDADQQYTGGHPVDFDSIHFGDCLFFDTNTEEPHMHKQHPNVSHVALALDSLTFLHASRNGGGVARGSFDRHSPWYMPSMLKRFVGARRYIEQ